MANADLVCVFGGRVNWMLHFGLHPRFHKDVQWIQVDLCASELTRGLGVLGDVGAVVGQLLERMMLSESSVYKKSMEEWCRTLQYHKNLNQDKQAKLCRSAVVPLGYYYVMARIAAHLPSDFLMINEGANTMDIGRVIFQHAQPRRRLDAGTFGTMGVGLGFAVAAALLHPGTRIVCVMGDSAFGFR